MDSIKGKWALVTGASRGIGSIVAEGLASHGCNVVVQARTEANAEHTLTRVRNCGVEGFAVGAELDDSQQVEQLIQTVLERLGGVDVLYNNAAIMNPQKEVCEIPMEDWQAVFNVNVFAPVRLCAAFVPIMKKRGFGRVVNVSSGIEKTPQLAPYGASKWAIDKFTEELASDLTDTNVLVNAVDPGWIKTDMGGAQADYELDTVLPGMLVPVLLQKGDPSGRKYQAQDFKHLKQ
jgi:NAD(P)-dependent dehydrogenase (short-subunit alcohol dehydrogenase family)